MFVPEPLMKRTLISSSVAALALVPVIFARVEKLSFARLFRRSRLERPVLISAGTEGEPSPARVVNG
jgi:hypothetical protein